MHTHAFKCVCENINSESSDHHISRTSKEQPYSFSSDNLQSVKKKKKNQNIPINFNTNYCREMKLIPINVSITVYFNLML